MPLKNRPMDDLRRIAELLAAKYRASHPHWLREDSPLKYVSWALEETLAKSAALAKLLQPPAGSRVFEFGPGAGFLLHTLATDYGCRVSGCDVPNRPLYRDVHAALGITTVVDERITAQRPIAALDGAYDYLIATQISWMDIWTQADVDFFLADCFRHLADGGQIVLFPNPKAFQGLCIDAIFRSHPAYVQLPYLNRGVILHA